MATLVLGAVGTAIGGPLGGALGAMLGRQVDGALFGPGPAEGPRLKELALTTSTYGQPIPRHAGRMRTGGTVIWAADIKEDEETSGGKGQPRTTTYSYSASFAVALGMGPIEGVGRIWADGNLLRGAAGDLKVPGRLRVHRGWADQRPDPLILAAQGPDCPAFRGRAYAVFEDLQLAEFGNRLPSLTFEVLAGTQGSALGALLLDADGIGADRAALSHVAGFSHEGGSYRQLLATLGDVEPLRTEHRGGGLLISPERNGLPLALPGAAAWDGGEFGQRDGQAGSRAKGRAARVDGLRYYDTQRDYQPGLQRMPGRHEHGEGRVIEFPGALGPREARLLADAAAQRSLAAREALAWRCAELDPAIGPGCLVRAPGHPGLWRVRAWEWRDGGVELELQRHQPVPANGAGADSGSAWTDPDIAGSATLLDFVELPPFSPRETDNRSLYAAVRSSGAKRARAALYRDRQGELVPIADVAVRQAEMGRLATPLPSSPATRFQPDAGCDVAFADGAFSFAPASLGALADGANRLLVGNEVLQFADAASLGNGVWRLRGLLRGRGGTEIEAAVGLPAGAPVLNLDRLTPLPLVGLGEAAPSRIAALGLADAEPVVAELRNPGVSRLPPAPVHCRLRRTSAGVELSWVRRARGAWTWLGGVDAPLVEEAERYVVGAGDLVAPLLRLEVAEPRLVLPAEQMDRVAQAPSALLWVRQVGTFGLSPPAFLPPSTPS